MDRSFRYFAQCLTALVVIGGAAAQATAPAWRAHVSERARFEVGGVGGMISLRPAETSGVGQMASVAVWSKSSQLLSASMPFEYCGAVVSIGDGHFVACGGNTLASPTAFLVRFEVGAAWSSINILETAMYPALDFVDVAYDSQAGLLAILDDETRCLAAAPMTAPASPSAAPILPGGFSLTVTPTQLPELKSPQAIFGFDNGQFIFRASRFGGPYVLLPQSPIWSVTASSDARANEWRVKSEVTHGTNLQVRSDAGQLGADNSFTVVSSTDGLTVGSGAITSVGAWHGVTPPAYFYEYPGYPCHVAGPLSTVSAEFFSFVRYGNSNSGVDISLGKAKVVADSVRVASSGALCVLRTTVPSIDAGEAAPVAQTLNGYLLLGLGYRGPGASPDPVTGTGTNARLQFTEALAVTGYQVYQTAHMGASVALPNVPELASFVLLTQWAVVDPGDPQALVYSDICAVRIRPGASAAAASSLTGGALTGGALSGAQCSSVKGQFRAFLNTDPRTQNALNIGSACGLLQHRAN
jgi:hypothetical protein